MDFKKLPFKTILFSCLFGLCAFAMILWQMSLKTQASAQVITDNVPKPVFQVTANQAVLSDPAGYVESKEEDTAIEQQLERDRQEQRETKYLKNKLEQTDLELQEQKALAEINKLKMENIDGYSDTNPDGPKNIPEVKIEYIGGNENNKEAIISLGGNTYQVREKSTPTDKCQVLSISDSSITVHYSKPIDTTKTIYFKPE